MDSYSNLHDAKNDLLDEDMDISDDNEIVEQTINIKSTNVDDVPKIGMLFDTFDEAKCYYNSYAKRVGFSIRIRRTVKKKGDSSIIRMATFVCSCEGEYQKIKTPQKRREDRRFGCKAEFRVLYSTGKYKVSEFVEEHTHELARPNCAHLLRSQRQIMPTQALLIDQMQAAGIGPSDINSYMREAAGGAQNLNFTQSDCFNYVQKKRRDFLKEGDVNCLKDWFRQKKRENKHFFNSFWIDDTGEVRGIFFCDAKSRHDYELFGDVICFDTTFKTNNYNMVCAPIVGVNHHWQTTLFGCGLLEGETTEAIVWLFTTFLEVMGGKEPEVIFTDQSAAIKNAILTVFTNTHHRLCLWHIYQNVSKHLKPTISKYSEFSKELKWCIYNPETIAEFEACWAEMIQQFELTDNEYLQSLFRNREEWALAYGRAHFCAGMTTTQRSESINNFLKDFFGTTTILREFVEQYMKAMNNRRESERVQEHNSRQTKPILFGSWNVEKEASEVYTKKIFYKFQEEYKKLGDLDIHEVRCEEAPHTYSVIQLDGKSRPRIVFYNPSTQLVSCTCRKFEFEGIICCHALRLFRLLGFTSLPSVYYLKRWTMAISNEVVVDSYGESILNDIDPLVASRYSELSHITQRIVGLSSMSNLRCFEARNTLLELEKKIVAIDINDVQLGNNSRRVRTISGVDSDEDVILQNPKSKKVRGEQKRRKKSVLEVRKRKTNYLTKGRVESDASVGASQPILPNLNEPSHDSLSTIVGSYAYHQLWKDTPFIGTDEYRNVSRRLFDSSFSECRFSFEE